MFSSIKNKYIKFALHLLVLFLLVLIIDRIGGSILRKLYYSQIAGTNYETTYAMDSTRADILIFGSSRAIFHYVPEIFEDSLKMSCFNCGRHGSFAMYNYAVFKAITARYTPRTVILDITPEEFNFNNFRYERLSPLLPYYQNHPEIRDIVELRGPYEKIKLLSAIYPYNSLLFEIGTGNLELKGSRKIVRNGYMPQYNLIPDSILRFEEDYKGKGVLDSNSIKVVTKMAQICRQRHIRFIIVTSPFYAKFSECYTAELLEKFANENKTEYFSFINAPLFINNSRYFQDQNHLNNDGATIFSQMLVSKLKKHIL